MLDKDKTSNNAVRLHKINDSHHDDHQEYAGIATALATCKEIVVPARENNNNRRALMDRPHT